MVFEITSGKSGRTLATVSTEAFYFVEKDFHFFLRDEWHEMPVLDYYQSGSNGIMHVFCKKSDLPKLLQTESDDGTKKENESEENVNASTGEGDDEAQSDDGGTEVQQPQDTV